MSAQRGRRLLIIACVCALAALGLMTWQIVDPTVWPVMVAMSLGQVLGTASFAMFGYVVLADYRSRRRAEKAPGAAAPTGVLSGEMPGTGGEIPPT
jgi:MFS family permease